MCLGQEDAADLRAPLRASESNDLVNAAIDAAILRKPKGHDFVIDRRARARRLAPHERDRRLIRSSIRDAHSGHSPHILDAPRERVLAHEPPAGAVPLAISSEFLGVVSARQSTRHARIDGRDGGLRHQRHGAEADRAALSARRSHHRARHHRDAAGRVVRDRAGLRLRAARDLQQARARPHRLRRHRDGPVHDGACSHAARRTLRDQSRLAAAHHRDRGDLLRRGGRLAALDGDHGRLSRHDPDHQADPERLQRLGAARRRHRVRRAWRAT